MTSFALKRVRILVGCAALVVAAFALVGCGSSETPVAPTPVAGPVTHTAASGTAITDKLSFDQLTLESPPVTKSDKNGLIFLYFKYADNDGKVYQCVLPKAQSEGQYTLAEWSSTFAAYRLPKVLAVKKTSGKVDLGDYPFISPRPQQQPQAQQPGQDMATPPMPEVPGQPPMAPMAPVGRPGTGEPGAAPP